MTCESIRDHQCQDDLAAAAADDDNHGSLLCGYLVHHSGGASVRGTY